MTQTSVPPRRLNQNPLPRKDLLAPQPSSRDQTLICLPSLSISALLPKEARVGAERGHTFPYLPPSFSKFSAYPIQTKSYQEPPHPLQVAVRSWDLEL